MMSTSKQVGILVFGLENKSQRYSMAMELSVLLYMTPLELVPSQPTAQIQFEPLLDTAQAGALLILHPRSVARLAREGRIPGHLVGKYWRFRASELNAWLASQPSATIQVPPASPSARRAS